MTPLLVLANAPSSHVSNLSAMHQSLEHDCPPDADATLRLTLRQALARDLNVSEHHAAVSATLRAFATIGHSSIATVKPATPTATIDTWWCIVAHTHALTAK